jgi:3-deoxy-D-manno-octulosonate 8-phosphate phosphatase (KDO 8-P phosphatase)
MISTQKAGASMIKLLILDVDGVLTDGTKFYDKDHNVLAKRFLCKDFTAIKRFMAAGVRVVMLSGDIFNKTMANKRNIDFYCSRNSDLSLDKSRFLDEFEEKYDVQRENMAFVGDDYFDLSMFGSLKYTFATSDAPNIIKDSSLYTTFATGGEGVVVELYDLFIEKGWIVDASEDQVAELDKQEATSKEMS